MSATVNIGSSAEWSKVLSSSSVVIVDFYADWCGPCKTIAPAFESLSTKYSKPKKITFCKVNVDNQREVAQKYSVRAMPTFLILHNGSVVNTIQGANPPALAAAVEKAIKLAGPGAGQTFGTQGQRLGGTGIGGPSRPSTVQSMQWDLGSFFQGLVTFFGLYFVSLFSLDPYKAAEKSQYNKSNPVQQGPAGTGRPGAAKRPAFGTMADVR